MSFVTHAQNKDAQAFKTLVEETLAEKVVMVLEALKVEVASQFFNEEGGISGGVSSVKKKPAPPAAGTVVLPGEGKEGGMGHAGRGDAGGEKSGDIELPGQKGVSESKQRPWATKKDSKIMAKMRKQTGGLAGKKPKLPQKKGSGVGEDRKSMD